MNVIKASEFDFKTLEMANFVMCILPQFKKTRCWDENLQVFFNAGMNTVTDFTDRGPGLS